MSGGIIKSVGRYDANGKTTIAHLQEVHRLRGVGREGSGGDTDVRAAGGCIVYNASVGSLLVIRRRDKEVDVLNLAILPFMDGWTEEEASSSDKRGAGDFSNYVSFEAASKVGRSERWIVR